MATKRKSNGATSDADKIAALTAENKRLRERLIEERNEVGDWRSRHWSQSMKMSQAQHGLLLLGQAIACFSGAFVDKGRPHPNTPDDLPF